MFISRHFKSKVRKKFTGAICKSFFTTVHSMVDLTLIQRLSHLLVRVSEEIKKRNFTSNIKMF